MYEYKYVEVKSGSFFIQSNHREIINEHARAGWRFVAAIPSYNTAEGKIRYLDLVFERPKNTGRN